LQGAQIVQVIDLGHPVSLGQAVAEVKRREAKSASASAVGSSSAQAAACIQNGEIFSLANGLFTSAELGYGGGAYAMLRARAPVANAWELFELCNFINTPVWFIVSQANGLAVSAELGYGGGDYAMLRARASVVDAWEQFGVQDNGDGSVSILSFANSLWVSAELLYTDGNYGELRARSGAIAAWERFGK
jgi:hypothetical protein